MSRFTKQQFVKRHIENLLAKHYPWTDNKADVDCYQRCVENFINNRWDQWHWDWRSGRETWVELGGKHEYYTIEGLRKLPEV